MAKLPNYTVGARPSSRMSYVCYKKEEEEEEEEKEKICKKLEMVRCTVSPIRRNGLPDEQSN